ncbi:MAG: hypothetical protein QXU69_03865 [Thermofilaceae archaeon]
MLVVEWRDADLMEEEVLVVRERGSITFNFHRMVFARVVGKHLRNLKPLLMEIRGERVVLKLNQEEGEELRAWLLLNLNKGFFITELECLELR